MYDAATLAALERGDLVVRDFFTAFARTRDAQPSIVTFGFWTGEDDIAANVVPLGATAPVSRNFIGGGMLRDVPEIVDVIGLEFQTVTFGFDHLSTFAGSPMDMVFGHDARVARVELHRGIYDPDSWQLVASPHLIFAGRVDGAEKTDAAPGSEGALRVDVAGAGVDRSRTSSAMKSHEQQLLRAGDGFRRYGNTAADYEVWWGMAKDDAKGGQGKIIGGGNPRQSGRLF